MTFGARLKSIRKEKKITQLELSKMTGITRSSIAQYETDTYQPDLEKIEKFATVLNVSISDFFNENKINKFIPLVGLASCGVPQDYSLDGYEAVPIDSKLYRYGMYALEAEGDSMSPKINNGNIVYCSPNEEIRSGDIVHYRINGESGIKKYKINKEHTIISLIPINTEHDIITIDEFHENGLVMAKVVGVVDMNF